MNSQSTNAGSKRTRISSPHNQEYTTYKDFTSENSLKSADFEASIGEVLDSFYSSSGEHQDKIFMDLAEKLPVRPSNKCRTKEEETDFTSKPALVLEKDEGVRISRCNNCIFISTGENNCAII